MKYCTVGPNWLSRTGAVVWYRAVRADYHSCRVWEGSDERFIQPGGHDHVLDATCAEGSVLDRHLWESDVLHRVFSTTPRRLRSSRSLSF